MLAGLSLDDGKDLVHQCVNLYRLESQIFGSCEFQEALNDLIQPADFTFDDRDVLQRTLDRRRQRSRTPGAKPEHSARRGNGFRLSGNLRRANLRPQQLEVNHHRVERILYFVGNAGGQPPECDQLPRVGKRGLHPGQMRQISRDEQHANELTARAGDGMRHDEFLVGRFHIRLHIRRRVDTRTARSDHYRFCRVALTLHRTTRPARGKRLLNQRTIRMPVGQQAVQGTPDRIARKGRLHRRIAEQQLT